MTLNVTSNAGLSRNLFHDWIAGEERLWNGGIGLGPSWCTSPWGHYGIHHAMPESFPTKSERALEGREGQEVRVTQYLGSLSSLL